MAGFDEGAVFYSDQRTDDRFQENVLTRHSAKNIFAEFIRNFTVDGEGGDGEDVYKYRELIRREKTQLRVDLQDLIAFDCNLAAKVMTSPSDYLPLLELAASEQLALLQNLTDEGDTEALKQVQVQLYSSKQFGPTSMRTVSSQQVAHLVMIPGIVTSAAKPKHKATRLTIMCKTCKNTKHVACKPGFGGAVIPRGCDMGAMPGTGGADCGLDPFVVLPSKSGFVDQQTLKLQERPEDVPTGEMPRNMVLLVDRNLCGKISPGTRITAIGIFSIQSTSGENGGKSKENKGSTAIRLPYLQVVGLRDDIETSGHSAPVFTPEEEARFREYAAQPGIHKRIYDQIAPQIFGSENIKRAIACLLFGGARKKMPDGTFRRGDINVLLLGDPSTAKSQFLKFASKIANIAVYTSGKGSSAAGLTASVIRDANGEFYLEGGAMVLADNGVVCIDEFDKMRPEDRVAIHEAMEQQTISIAKAGITTMLKSRTSVLAAANPPSGRYDDLKTAQENIDLQTTILSRFDLIFIVKDERSAERDKQIAQHVLNVHRMAGAQTEPDEEAKKEELFLKRYLEFCRTKCAPRLSEHGAAALASQYVDLREEVRQAAAGNNDEMPAVPITVRQLEAIVRISESLARMQLLTTATEQHVREAIELFKVSTMDAVRSGVVDIQFTDEQRAELHAAEVQIKRRIAIGSYVSERKLVDELVRVGFVENTVRKALVSLQQVGELDYRRERRMLHRLK